MRALWRFGSYSPMQIRNVMFCGLMKLIYIHIYPIILSPIRGGGDYRGIYDIVLKRLLWDIGLLLNAPYKIDSMVWMTLMMIDLMALALVCTYIY
jgi:hypothetical protein